MQIHLHEKFKNQMTSLGVSTLTRGRKREAHPEEEKPDAPRRIGKALPPPAASGKLDIICINVACSFDAEGGKYLKNVADDNSF